MVLSSMVESLKCNLFKLTLYILVFLNAKVFLERDPLALDNILSSSASFDSVWFLFEDIPVTTFMKFGSQLPCLSSHDGFYVVKFNLFLRCYNGLGCALTFIIPLIPSSNFMVGVLVLE